MENIIKVTDLYKTFKIPRGDDIEVLKGITLKVKPGEFITIMGPSGSGKSTLLNIISSIEDITKGTVLIDGEDLAKVNLVETRRYKSSILELLEKVQLAHRAEHIPDDLSGGEKQRVAIARALANDPKILLADEPTGNLDTKTGDAIIELFREIITEKKITVIIVTHDIQVARQTDRILILREGTLHQEEDVLEEL